MIGIAAALLLIVLLTVKAGEARHLRKQSARFELLYLAEQSAAARTVANYRAAAETARAADRANAVRVAATQRAITERTANDFDTRLADARARALRLRLAAGTPPAAGGPRRATAVPAPGATAGAIGPAAEKDRLPDPDRLIATEQAIQLDELIKWVKGQAALTVAGEAGAKH